MLLEYRTLILWIPGPANFRIENTMGCLLFLPHENEYSSRIEDLQSDMELSE